MTVPTVSPSASVAATAVLVGDVRVGPHCRIQHGAILDAGDGVLHLGNTVIVMENAVLRATRRFPLTVGDHSLVGPHASISGATIGDEVFLATGASVFPGAVVGARSEVRINGVVHLRTTLPEGSVVPIGWVAVGNPVQILAPGEHDRIWEAQAPLDFPGFVFGVDRTRTDAMVQLTERCSQALGRKTGPGGNEPQHP